MKNLQSVVSINLCAFKHNGQHINLLRSEKTGSINFHKIVWLKGGEDSTFHCADDRILFVPSTCQSRNTCIFVLISN